MVQSNIKFVYGYNTIFFSIRKLGFSTILGKYFSMNVGTATIGNLNFAFSKKNKNSSILTNPLKLPSSVIISTSLALGLLSLF